MENAAEAQEYYRKLYSVEPKALERIPDAYLESVDKRAYEKRMKDQAKEREAREKEIREKLQEKSRPADGNTK